MSVFKLIFYKRKNNLLDMMVLLLLQKLANLEKEIYQIERKLDRILSYLENKNQYETPEKPGFSTITFL
jgi:hypothetical protein